MIDATLLEGHQKMAARESLANAQRLLLEYERRLRIALNREVEWLMGEFASSKDLEHNTETIRAMYRRIPAKRKEVTVLAAVFARTPYNNFRKEPPSREELRAAGMLDSPARPQSRRGEIPTRPTQVARTRTIGSASGMKPIQNYGDDT